MWEEWAEKHLSCRILHVSAPSEKLKHTPNTHKWKRSESHALAKSSQIREAKNDIWGF